MCFLVKLPQHRIKMNLLDLQYFDNHSVETWKHIFQADGTRVVQEDVVLVLQESLLICLSIKPIKIVFLYGSTLKLVIFIKRGSLFRILYLT